MEFNENLGTTVEVTESAGAGEVVSAQNETSNGATPDAGQTEVVGGHSEAAKAPQSKEDNTRFKQMRQRMEELQRENARYREMAKTARETVGISSEDADDLRREMIAQREGVSADIIRSREESEQRRIADAVKSSPDFVKQQRELEYYRNIAAQHQRDTDLAELKAKFPADNVESIEALGEQFAKLRLAGVDNLTAYAAVRATKQATAKPVPPDTGAVGNAGSQERDYYTPEEVDKLTPKQLDDPKIMDKVMKSMTKWKK